MSGWIDYASRPAVVSAETVIAGYYDEDGYRRPGELTILTMRAGSETWACDEDGGRIEFAAVDVGGYEDFAVTSRDAAWKFFAADIDRLAGVVVSAWRVEATKMHNAKRAADARP